MKTTVELPDAVYRQIKARAALRGQTIRSFLLEAVREKLTAERSRKKGPAGWRSVFGKANREDVEALQRFLDSQFSAIDLETWR